MWNIILYDVPCTVLYNPSLSHQHFQTGDPFTSLYNNGLGNIVHFTVTHEDINITTIFPRKIFTKSPASIPATTRHNNSLLRIIYSIQYAQFSSPLDIMLDTDVGRRRRRISLWSWRKLGHGRDTNLHYLFHVNMTSHRNRDRIAENIVLQCCGWL